MSLPPTIHLIYGNQPLPVRQAREALEKKVLEPDWVDFALHRFDVEELQRTSAGEAAQNWLEQFQIAAESVPFLAERYVVHLHHVEKLKAPRGSLPGLMKQLEDTILKGLDQNGSRVWVAAEHLLPQQDQPVSEARLLHWVTPQDPLPDGRVPLELPPPEHAPTLLVPNRGQREPQSLKSYLRVMLKGKYAFADELTEADWEVDDSTAKQGAGSASAQLYQLVLRLVAAPPPGLWLILTGEGTKEGDFSAPVLKAIKAAGGVVDKHVTYDNDSPLPFLQKEAQHLKLELSPEQAQQLIQRIGHDRGRLMAALQKLALLYPPGTPIEPDGFKLAVHGEGGFSPFVVAQRLANRQLEPSLTLIGQLLGEKANQHHALLGMLSHAFRQYQRVHALRRSGIPTNEAAQQLGLHPRVLQTVAGQADQFHPEELERILMRLAEIDVLLKQVRQVDTLLFVDFVQQVCLRRYAPLSARS